MSITCRSRHAPLPLSLLQVAGNTCAAEAPGGTGQGKGRSKCAHKPILEGNQRGLNGEELEEGKVGSRTYSRLVTEVSATELRLGIEGRVSPVEDKTWPPCRDQGRGQTVIRSRVAQIEDNKKNNNS